MKHRNVEALPIRDIAPHEEYNPQHLSRLRDRILSKGVLEKPILVDKGTGMIIDGTHRYTILKELGMEAIPAITIDYLRANIQIGPWNRLFKGITLKNIVLGDDGEVEILMEKGVYKVSQPKEAYEAIRRIDRLNLTRLVGYTPDIPKPNGVVVVTYKPPSKEEVIDFFSCGGLFPPKYTRHIHRIRIPRINAPLEKMRDVDILRRFLLDL